MIGRIRGELAEKQPPRLLIDVNGIGYELEAPMSTIFELPEVGQSVTLLTHFHVREDAQILYAFLTEAERLLFRQLLKVNGVGARMALAILSGMNPVEFSQCIHNADQTALVRLPGIGKKTAERLIVEMRDRVERMTDVIHTQNTSGSRPTPANDPVAEAVEALVALGYRPQEAGRMINKVATPEASSEMLIRHALKGTL